MKFYFLASIDGLKLNRVHNKGINIIGGIRLSNSKIRLDKIIDDFFEEAVGGLEIDELYNKPYVYYEGNIEDSINKEKSLSILDYYLKMAQIFSNSLWLIKDNSVSVQQGFIYFKNEGKPHLVSSNVRTPVFFNSKGQREQVGFTNEELRWIADFISGMNYEYAEKANDEMSMLVSTISNRIERFNYFLQSTRVETHLPSKISMYCTLLETLLSTDKEAITHKISERLARILGNNHQERIEIYDFIKSAYDVRSSTIHGSKLNKKYKNIDKIKELSSKFDDYIRSLFVDHILSDEKLNRLYTEDDNEKLNVWFKELILK
ncbi:hypothetical protein ABEW95_17395 [Bacillus subtilis]